MAGFGSQPFGSSPYGIGTPSTAPAVGGALLRDTFTGETHGGRYIDPYTKDYVLDENGRTLGMSNTKQLVLLAVSTTKGRSAMRTLGNELLGIDRITSNFLARARNALTFAVQHIVDEGLIEVRGVTAEVIRPGVAFATLQWRDLSTGLDEETLVGSTTPSGSLDAGGGVEPELGLLMFARHVRPIASGAPLPVLASLDYDQASTDDAVTVTGTDLDSAISLTVGGTSATITSNTSTTITFTMPAKSAGSHDVEVTTAAGTSNTLSIEWWAPSVLSLTGWWRASYGGSPWVGVASAGGSGTHNLSEGTNPPSTGSAVNGLTPADFDGVNDKIDNANTIGTFLTASAWSAAVLIWIDNVSTATATTMCSIVGNSAGGFWGLGHRDNSGPKVYSYIWDGANKSIEIPITTGAWHLVQAKLESGIHKLRIDGGSWTTLASGNVTNLANSLRVGQSYTGSHFGDQKILDLALAGSAISDANFEKIRKYVNARYALSL